MAQPQPAAGWYPDPADPQRQIYWDGSTWTAPVATDKPSSGGRQAAVAAGACVLVGIGLFMTMQSVSLLTGSGPVWTGVAVVAGGTALAFVMGGAKWVKVVAVVVLAVAVLNAFYIENEMSKKRDELTHIFHN